MGQYTVYCNGSQNLKNLSGGVGIPYLPEQQANDIRAIGEGVHAAYDEILVPAGMGDVAIFSEMGRFTTGPYGALVSTVIHEKHIYKEYIGLDACAANLMRPAMYGAYHHITVLGKENEPCDHKYDVVAVDCGIKHNIIRQLNRVGCNVTIVPYDSTVEEIMAFHPDGIVLSNGPGNPEDVTPVIGLVRQLRGKLPIFGICMGHQLISLAYGAKTVKMKFGHRGGNHPVKNLETGRIEITSQNHSYAVDIDSLAATGLRLTHVNLLDGTAEGVECAEDGVFSMQYHPESASGPQDSSYLFKKFTKIMEERKNA